MFQEQKKDIEIICDIYGWLAIGMANIYIILLSVSNKDIIFFSEKEILKNLIDSYVDNYNIITKIIYEVVSEDMLNEENEDFDSAMNCISFFAKKNVEMCLLINNIPTFDDRNIEQLDYAFAA